MKFAVIWEEAARGVGRPSAGHIGITTARKIYSEEKTTEKRQLNEFEKISEPVESGPQDYPAYRPQMKRLMEQRRRMIRETGIG